MITSAEKHTAIGGTALLQQPMQQLNQGTAHDTPSFSFQDNQSTKMLLSNHNNNYGPTLSQNQTQFSMKTDGTLVKALKNTQSMQPLVKTTS